MYLHGTREHPAEVLNELHAKFFGWALLPGCPWLLPPARLPLPFILVDPPGLPPVWAFCPCGGVGEGTVGEEEAYGSLPPQFALFSRPLVQIISFMVSSISL